MGGVNLEAQVDELMKYFTPRPEQNLCSCVAIPIAETRILRAATRRQARKPLNSVLPASRHVAPGPSRCTKELHNTCCTHGNTPPPH